MMFQITEFLPFSGQIVFHCALVHYSIDVHFLLSLLSANIAITDVGVCCLFGILIKHPLDLSSGFKNSWEICIMKKLYMDFAPKLTFLNSTFHGFFEEPSYVHQGGLWGCLVVL